MNDELIGYIQDIVFKAKVDGSMEITMEFPKVIGRKSSEVIIQKLSDLGVNVIRK